jgi:uncharacterized SAM-binding protein YcdF (DUF218 family)
MRGLRVAVSSVVLLAATGLLFHNQVLGAIGGYLVRQQAPSKADIALVLGGDFSGHRIVRAAELERQGYVPQVLVSGPAGAYGLHECELAIAFAERAGYPKSYFRHLEHDGHSTRDEAHIASAFFRETRVHTVLLVTSDYHTRRAGSIFREVAPDITYIVIAAPDEHFSAGGWWRDREGRKIALLEWTKTVANWFKL